MSQNSAKGGGLVIGSAGGDLSGSYPNPTVAKANGATIPASGSLTTGNVLQVSGSATLTYGAINLAGGANYVTGVLPSANQAAQTLGGDASGTTAAVVVIKIQGNAAKSGTLGSAHDGYVFTWNNSNSRWEETKYAGDVTGKPSVSIVERINGATVPASGSLTTGNVLQVSGSSTLTYGALNLAGGAGYVTGVLPVGNQAFQTMAGDVSGTTAVSQVDKIKTKNLATALSTIGATQDGYVLTWVNGSTEWQAKPTAVQFTAGGDLSGTPTSQTVEKIKGTTITTAGGALSVGAVLRVTGVATADWGQLDLADTDAVTGVLPEANQADQTMGGDVSGSTSAATVTKIRGNAVKNETEGAAQDGYLLTWVNGNSQWEALPPAPTVTFAGDLSGTPTNQTVTGLQTNPVHTATPTAGQILTWDDVNGWWEPADAPSGTFTAGGDLSGSSSSQTVEKVKGTTITTAGGSLAVGAVLRTTAGGVADWGQVDLADTDAVTGVLPKANQGAQDMAGDVTGTTAASVVEKIRTKTLDSALASIGAGQDQYVLTWDNSDAEWQAKPAPGAASGVTTVDTIDTSPNANGLFISTANISTQTATASVPGMVSTTTQTFAGAKTFTGAGSFSSTLSVSGALTAGSSTTKNTMTGGLVVSQFVCSSALTLGDGYFQILVDTSAARSITLPAPQAGRVFEIIDKTGTAQTNVITLVRNGSEKINGVTASKTLQTNWGYWKIACDGTDWYVG